MNSDISEVTVRMVRIERRCPECDEGRMRPSRTYRGVVDSVGNTPAKTLYPHECDKCGHCQKYEKTYPYLEQRDQRMPEVIPWWVKVIIILFLLSLCAIHFLSK